MDIRDLKSSFHEFAENSAKKILNSTCQFFYDGNKGHPIGEGTGVLIEIDNKGFLVSAAHVLEKKDVYLLQENYEISLGGKKFYTPIPEDSKREDDQIDIGVLELNTEDHERFKEFFEFISLDKIEVNHHVTKDNYYMAIGFPSSKTDRTDSVEYIKSKPFIFTTQAIENEDLIKQGYSYSDNIFVEYNKKEVQEPGKNHLQIGPDPDGNSGGGLWHIVKNPGEFNIEIFENYFPYKLVGILIEHKRREKVMIATRIDHVTEFIRKQFNLRIPKSDFNLNLE